MSGIEREGRGKTFQALSAVIYCQQKDLESLANCYQPGKRECGHVKLPFTINGGQRKTTRKFTFLFPKILTK